MPDSDPDPVANALYMTHWAPQAPKPPYQPQFNVQQAGNLAGQIGSFLTSGIDLNPIQSPGTQPRDYLRDLAQNPEIMRRSIEQASNFLGLAGMTSPYKGFSPVRGTGNIARHYSGELVDRAGNKVPVNPEHEHLFDSLTSYEGDLQKTLEGYRESYQNYPRPERLDDIIQLEHWKRQG